MKGAFKFTVVLFGLLNIVGCVSSNVAKVASPVMMSKPVSLDIIFVTISSSAGDLEPEKHSLGDAIISGLNESKMFATVTGNKTDVGSGSGVKVNVDIKEIKKVSDDAREWAGALAGRAHILVHATVSDLQSGNQIEVFEVEGQSGESAFAGTTDEAIQQAAQQVVAEVLKLNAQTSQ